MKQLRIYCALLVVLLVLPGTFTHGKSIFWEAKSPTATVYLLGSIHMGKDTMYPLKPVIEKAFQKSRALVVELNINTVNQKEVMEELYYKDGKTLKTELSDSLYKKFEDTFKKLGVSIVLFHSFKPSALIQTLSLLAYSKAGYKAELGVDVHFIKKAEKQKKEIIELETIEEQLDLLTDEANDTSESYLYYALDDFESSITMVDSLMYSWLDGDSDRLDRLVNSQAGENQENDEYMTKILDDRNYKMTDKIEGFLGTKKIYFVIVGAAHLVGEKGIVNLLLKTGKYTVKQL